VPGAPVRYQRPGWITTHVLNRTVGGLTRLGISVRGTRVLEARGRKSGLPRRTPVNLLDLDGHQYLVSPRGETEWVRNVRADGGRLALILGSRRDERVATEVTGAARVPILRAYLRRWKSEVGMFFEGVGPDSSDAELAAIADRHPVWELSPPR